MKRHGLRTVLFILILLLALAIHLSVASAKEYTISTPRITTVGKKVTLEWNQTQDVLVTVYKISYVRKLSNNCKDIETSGANCTLLFITKKTGNIKVIDKGYKKGDQYFIQQNVYQTHNGGYGPFVPR